MQNSEEYDSARKRVEAKVGFYTHLAIYVSVILFLAVINLVTSSHAIWFHWPMLGWGIAITLHAAFVFVFPGRFAVTERMIEKELARRSGSNS